VNGFVPVVIMIGLGLAFGVGSVVASRLLGPRKPTPEKEAPYECGVPPVGDARERQSVKFYLVAMIFLLFDIEVAFLYPWAVALGPDRNSHALGLGVAGVVQVVTFFALLVTGYIYVWRKGVFDWSGERRR
jgi:NADH-quinone oxidoreductase subunit A